MKINERDALSLEKFKRRALMRALRKGQMGMIEAGKTFLPKEKGETDDTYSARLNRSTLFNATKKAVQSLSGKPFSKPVSIDYDENRLTEKLAEIELSFDSKGNSLAMFARKAFVDGLWNGLTHFLVDRDTAGEGNPYVTLISDDAILGAEEIDDELVLLRILESFKKMAPDGLGVATYQRVRVFRKFDGRVEWATYDEIEPGKGEFPEAVEWNALSLDYIPLVSFYASTEEASFFDCESPLSDLAYVNLGHWQESSDQKNIVHVSKIPILFARGLEEETEIKIGVDNIIIGSAPEADMKYVEHTGAAINAGRDSIKDLVAQMEVLGLEMLTLQTGQNTATGQAIQAESTNSNLAAMAISLAHALQRVFEIMGEYLLTEKLKVNVNIHTDYGITMSAQTLQALATARQLGDLSYENYMKELQRYNVVRPGLDLETNKDQLDAELHEVA